MQVLNFNFTFNVVCINFLWLYLERSQAGVGVVCKDGKFFDQSKQQFISCHECKTDARSCSLCCNQVKSHNSTNVRAPNRPMPPQHELGQNEKKVMFSRQRDISPNIFVVSTISFIMLISGLAVLLVIVKKNVERCEEERDCSSTESLRQRDVVTVLTLEAVRESANAEGVSDGNGVSETRSSC